MGFQMESAPKWSKMVSAWNSSYDHSSLVVSK